MAILDTSPPPVGGRRKTAVERLIDAIGYPERAPDGAVSFILRVDGMEIPCEENNGKVMLSMRLDADDARLPVLAGYAAGRMLKEDAALAWDSTGGGHAFIWQDAPSDSGGRTLLRLFETFMDSCDWWQERVKALEGDKPEELSQSMIIMP